MMLNYFEGDKEYHVIRGKNITKRETCLLISTVPIHEINQTTIIYNTREIKHWNPNNNILEWENISSFNNKEQAIRLSIKLHESYIDFGFKNILSSEIITV